MSVAFISLGTPLLQASGSPTAIHAARSTSRNAVSGDAHENGTAAALLQNIVASASKTGATGAARAALQKMASAAEMLGTADTLEGGLAAVMAAKARQSDQQLESAKTRVLQKLDQMRLQNMAERAQIDKRIEAAKSSSFWQRLVNFFKAIGAALSAASSIFTGPAGMVAAGLMIASLVISLAKPDDWGKWLSLGLSLAAIAVGGAGAIHNLVTAGAKTAGELGKAAALTAAEAAKETAKAGAKLGLQLTAAGSEAAAGGCAVAKGYYDAKGLDAQAALAELKALRHKLQAEADEAKDEIELVVEAQARCVKAALKIFESNHGATMRALGR